MPKNIQLFAFNRPIQQLIKDVSNYPVHIFARSMSGTALRVNDIQAQHFGAIDAASFQGKNYCDISSKIETHLIQLNDTIVLNSHIPLLCHEICLNKQALSIKTKLKNTSNNTIGIGGIVFYPHQIVLKDIFTVIKNKLNNLFPLENVLNSYTFNAPLLQSFTVRQKECVSHMVRGRTYKEIAKILNISPRTVETHIEHIKDKLGCYSRADIINKFFEEK